MTNSHNRIAIIGAGAAGFFAAIVVAELSPQTEVILLEKTRQPLAKVKISGGGRCNVTHNCYDPVELSRFYPRGSNQLKRSFYSFQPKDMIAWLEKRGVELKVEADGRMFPITNSSSTIIDCFTKEAKALGVKLQLESDVQKIEKLENGLCLLIKGKPELICDKVLMSTGGMQRSYDLAKNLGHTIMDPVPSLFTFNIKDPRIEDLMGLAIPFVQVTIENTDISAKGPLLITHWGLSGPAILKLSAWGARHLAEKQYKDRLIVNFVPELNEQKIREELMQSKQKFASKEVYITPLFNLPKNLWRKLLEFCQMTENKLWAHLSKNDMQQMLQVLQKSVFIIDGKSTNKDEFVTCGGVPWSEIDAKSMQSKICPGLFFAGEVVDSDGITGGFNFQNAWTTAWIAANSMVKE